jgi:hypothetical protein
LKGQPRKIGLPAFRLNSGGRSDARNTNLGCAAGQDDKNVFAIIWNPAD